jgi:hypothetical protein
MLRPFFWVSLVLIPFSSLHLPSSMSVLQYLLEMYPYVYLSLSFSSRLFFPTSRKPRCPRTFTFVFPIRLPSIFHMFIFSYFLYILLTSVSCIDFLVKGSLLQVQILACADHEHIACASVLRLTYLLRLVSCLQSPLMTSCPQSYHCHYSDLLRRAHACLVC